MTTSGAAPINDPAAYPGEPLPQSCILTSDRVWTMRLHATEDPWPVRSWWGVAADSGRLEEVDTVLRGLGAALMEERTPVLAVGSNAAAAQMRRKFASLDQWATPVAVVEVRGLIAAYSAHVSRPGYVPYAPAASGDEVWRRYHLQFLTDQEQAVLDRSEPNYTRVEVPASGALVVRLESGQTLPTVQLYASTHGVLTDQTGQVVRAASQVLALEIATAAFGKPVSHHDLAADGNLREAVTVALHGQAARDGIMAPQLASEAT